MNKTELIDKVAAETGATKKDTKVMVDTVFDKILDTLSEGEKFTLTGFGSFKVKERKARKGRNPQTGEDIKIPARKAVTFKAGKSLKDAVN